MSVSGKSQDVVPVDSRRANPVRRVGAKFIDLAVILGVAAIFYPVGPLLGFLYSLFADALPVRGFSGQSLGKKLLKLRAVSLKPGHSKVGADGAPALTYRDSLFRNAPVGVATFFALIPIWGWAILALIGFPMMIVEIYLLVRAPRGQRLGDVMADTEVVEL
ncbi:MAG: RDD family protein [Bdellovibrionales bacterium]|nr:RDD family protein [Bdellovibrionales bacterium]